MLITPLTRHDPNWKTLALLYEKPGSMTIAPLPTHSPPPQTTPRRRSTYPVFGATHYVFIIAIENSSSRRSMCPRGTYSPLMEQWLDTSMRHEMWFECY